MQRITSSTFRLNENLTRNTKNLNNFNSNPHARPTQARHILLNIAHDYDSMSEVFDKEIPIITKSFQKAMDVGIKMRELAALDETHIQSERDAITQMITANEDLLETIINSKASFVNQATTLDKTLDKSKKRLVQCFDRMIETLNYCIYKANELLNYT